MPPKTKKLGFCMAVYFSSIWLNCVWAVDSSGSVPLKALSIAPQTQPSFADPDLKEPKTPIVLTNKAGDQSEWDKTLAKKDLESKQKALHQYFLHFSLSDTHAPQALLEQGNIYFSKGEYSTAEALYRKILRSYSHQANETRSVIAEASVGLGKIALAHDEIAKSLYYYEFARDQFPNTSAGQNVVKDILMIRQSYEAP